MRLNPGIITYQLEQSVEFYTKTLGFGITFSNDWYALLHTPDKNTEIAFLLPNQPSQHPLFQKAHVGHGLFLTIEVDNVDEIYDMLKERGIRIIQAIRDEEWGERHFVIQDPNGIGIDIVTYRAPSGE